MTTAGLQVNNDSNQVLIDENNKNYQLKTSGSGTCSTSQTSGGKTRYYTSITITSVTAPLFAIGNTSGSAAVSLYFIGVSGSDWTFTVMSATNGATFDYWVFDVATSSPENFGLEVYTAAGALAFHSGLKPLRIVDILTEADGGDTYTSGRSYAVIQNQSGWRWTKIDFLTGTQYTAFLSAFSVTSGNVVSVGAMLYENFLMAGVHVDDSYTGEDTQFIVVDVTNL